MAHRKKRDRRRLLSTPNEAKRKAGPELTYLKDNVSRIRSSQNGGVTLKFKKCEDIPADKFFSKIGKFIGLEAEIRASGPKISIVCKDTGEVTTKEDVCESLEKGFGLIGLEASAVKTLQKASRENKNRLGYMSF